jgi:muramoyltetrapeptide carboxypeptidase
MVNDPVEPGNREVRIPQKLVVGDCIGIVAPASPFDRGKFEKGIEIIASMGFRVKVDHLTTEESGYLSASDEIRAMQIAQCFADPEIKAVFCARGGYGSIRILDLLDWETICTNPKSFVGFSDITTLLTAFYVKCGFAVFHGPMVATLADSDEVSMTALAAVLTQPDQYRLALEQCTILKRGVAVGPVIGGNLTSLCHLMGTPYAPKFSTHILFLEDRGETTYRIDRMLTHLKLAGCFDEIVGLVLGSFTDCGEYRDIERLALDCLHQSDIPCVSGLKAGHGEQNLAVPMGMPAILDTEAACLSFDLGA